MEENLIKLAFSANSSEKISYIKSCLAQLEYSDSSDNPKILVDVNSGKKYKATPVRNKSKNTLYSLEEIDEQERF